MKSIAIHSLETQAYDSIYSDLLIQKKIPVVIPLPRSAPSYLSASSPIPQPTPHVIDHFPTVHSGSIQENLEAEISSIDVDTCAENGENAFFVCDVGHVISQVYRWERELGGLVDPFFAVKCNPDPVILALFAKLRLGFDCASQVEIASVLSNGVDPQKIIYANPCKAASFIRNAAKTGVRKMTFDNCDELVKVKKFFPGAELVLRLLTDDSESLCRLGLKFGARLDDVEMLLLKARELELNVIGISFHVGSGCGNPYAFDDAIGRSFVAFEIGKKLGFNFNFLDIGGGFNDDTRFESVCDVIRTSLGKYFPGKKFQDGQGRDYDLNIIAEPGRYFVSRAFQLATNIIARRKKEDSTDEAADLHNVMCEHLSHAISLLTITSLHIRLYQ
jgi:ornithine decarboxylase